jgi:hypothetical protein
MGKKECPWDRFDNDVLYKLAASGLVLDITIFELDGIQLGKRRGYKFPC